MQNSDCLVLTRGLCHKTTPTFAKGPSLAQVAQNLFASCAQQRPNSYHCEFVSSEIKWETEVKNVYDQIIKDLIKTGTHREAEFMLHV